MSMTNPKPVRMWTVAFSDGSICLSSVDSCPMMAMLRYIAFQEDRGLHFYKDFKFSEVQKEWDDYVDVGACLRPVTVTPEVGDE